MNMRLTIPGLVLVCFISTNFVFSQDPLRFQAEIERMITEPAPPPDKLIIFTGSSSVRMWKNLMEAYPEFNLVNRGFGGSQMSDLLYYLDDLVLKSNPCQVFIYEGDNDISSGKTTEQIIMDTEAVCQKIWATNPDITIVLISAKPSVARWHLKGQYEQLNQAFKEMAITYGQLEFADVWTPSLDPDRMVFKDIFLEDNLHMNAKGYAIWKKTLQPFLRKCD